MKETCPLNEMVHLEQLMCVDETQRVELLSYMKTPIHFKLKGVYYFSFL